jgi:two-component system, chemotaxis family, chemotaxis protein CheY
MFLIEAFRRVTSLGVTSGRLCMTQILVVDDEKMIRELLRLALSLAGYGVVEACNGQEGLAVYHQTGIGLVITDLDMPQMDGMTMINALRSKYGTIPIIAISGVARSQGDHVKALGVQYTFQKPFCLSELLDAVRMLVRREP